MALAIVAEGDGACKIAYCRVCFDVFKANQGRGRPRKRCVICQQADARTTPKVYKYRYRPNRIRKPLSRQYHCKQCQTAFYPMGNDRTQFCCRQCAKEHRAIWGTEKRKARWPHSKVCFPTCQKCNVVFVSRRDGRKYCSPSCSAKHTLQCLYEQGVEAKGRKEFCCQECGTLFVAPYGDKRRTFCSEKCSIKSASRISHPKRRAMLRAARVETVDPFMVFERDHWKCRMCGVDTPRHLRGKHAPSSPELDHIVPLSRGGEHSYRNTQCLCRRCNAAKGDRIWATGGWVENKPQGGGVNFPRLG